MPLPKRRGYRHYDTKSQTSILSFWSRSALLSLQESNYRHRRAEPKRLKFPRYLFEFCSDRYFFGQRFSHAPHSLHKLAKWWLGRKPAVVFIYWLFPICFRIEAALYAAKQEGISTP